jgi:hypothetical protein
LLEAILDSDDPLFAGHLELEAGVVGDDHELGEARSTEEGMVDTGEETTSKVSGSLRKLSGCPKVMLSQMRLRGTTSFPSTIP